jgi:hypothetical protein
MPNNLVENGVWYEYVPQVFTNDMGTVSISPRYSNTSFASASYGEMRALYKDWEKIAALRGSLIDVLLKELEGGYKDGWKASDVERVAQLLGDIDKCLN